MLASLFLASAVTVTPAETPVIKFDNLTASGEGFMAPIPGPIKAKSLVYNAGTRWPDPKAIPQCWTNPEDGPEIVKDLESFVSKEYARAGIGFVWEGKCTAQSLRRVMIRTYLKPSHRWQVTSQIIAGGGLSFLGAINENLGGSDGNTATMNIEVGQDTKGYAPNQWRQWTQDMTRSTAVHEFGHAMGLAHEQDRNDAPVCQDIRGEVRNGGEYVFVGEYDRFSIMNYCMDPSNVYSLSDGDLKGLAYLYPRIATATPPPVTQSDVQPVGSWTIRVKASGQCLERVATGSKPEIKAAPCNGTASQAFFTDSAGKGQFWFKSAKDQKCVDIFGASRANGVKAYLWDCAAVSNQNFKFESVSGSWLKLKAKHSGRCLDLDPSGYLQQWTCSTTRDQQQTFGFFKISGKRPSKMGE